MSHWCMMLLYQWQSRHYGYFIVIMVLDNCSKNKTDIKYLWSWCMTFHHYLILHLWSKFFFFFKLNFNFSAEAKVTFSGYCTTSTCKLWSWYVKYDLINIWKFLFCIYGPSLVSTDHKQIEQNVVNMGTLGLEIRHQERRQFSYLLLGHANVYQWTPRPNKRFCVIWYMSACTLLGRAL